RGILFNVIGGVNMSMHEINTAAETITAAADPDANIIFGATISPDLEEESIITVVATGFQAAYFATLDVNNASSTLPTSTPVDDTNDNDLSNIDTTLDRPSDAGQAFDEKPMPNIWNIDNDDETDSSVQPGVPSADTTVSQTFVGTTEEDEL